MSLLPLFVVPLLVATTTPVEYPPSPRGDHIDTYHGTEVADPYRWLEDDVRESDDVANWVTAQNKVTFGYLNELEHRDAIAERLEELWNYERTSIPGLAGGRLFFSHNNGLQPQPIVYVQDAQSSEPRVLFDPNTWSKDGSVSLASWSVSDDGRHVAYSPSESGSDWRTWRIRDVATGNDLTDVIKWSKFSGATWAKDGSGFYYGRYDEPMEGEAFQAANTHQKLYFHAMGSDQSADRLIMESPEHPTWGFSPDLSHDGRWLIITISAGTGEKYRVLVDDLHDDAPPHVFADAFENEYVFLGSEGDDLFFLTDLEASRKRIIAVDMTKPSPWQVREIIGEADTALTSASFVGGRFLLHYLRDASSELLVHDQDGQLVDAVELPGIGTAGGFSGRHDHTVSYYSFSSLDQASTIYAYDIASGVSTTWRETEIPADLTKFTVERVFVTSPDGTQVPMFISHRKGIVLDGSNPLLLYGYGGFNISITPRFSVTRLAWMEMGGIYATACLRGGGEYGSTWHESGTKHDKQNVFDDFIASAQWLIDHHYTSPEKLGILGWSNGGLLVGAAITQRPDLFAAALPGVGVMDMLRFHKFTIGWAWVDDYGSSDDPEEFKTLRAYSPYHNLKEGVSYPATMVITADTDDRVVPGHSFKFAAALQHAHDGDDPVLIRIQEKAGHGAGKSTDVLIAETADMWAFLAENLGFVPMIETTGVDD